MIDTVAYEMTDYNAEFANTWVDYFEGTLNRINEVNAKRILFHLTQNPDRDWNSLQLKKELNLDLEPSEIKGELEKLYKAGFIRRMGLNIFYRGHIDGTFALILRHQFEAELLPKSVENDWGEIFQGELEKSREKSKSLQGALNHYRGKLAEMQLAWELYNRKKFRLSEYFEGGEDQGQWQVSRIYTRFFFQGVDGKNREIDVKLEASSGKKKRKVLLVEVKKTKQKTTLSKVKSFWKNVEVFCQEFPEFELVVAAYLSLGGFHQKALDYCESKNIATATEINRLWRHPDRMEPIKNFFICLLF